MSAVKNDGACSDKSHTAYYLCSDSGRVNSAANPFIHISHSCHSLEEVKEMKRKCDYVFLSPVFDSISKMNYNANYTPEEIKKAHKAGIIDKKVIALGGIDEDNIKQVKNYGFGGAAILGALWDKFDTCCDRDYACLIEHFKKLKKLAD